MTFSPRKIDGLLFGTPGIPISTEPRDTLNGIKQVKKLGLDAMEMEFVNSVHVSKEKAPEVKKAAEKEGIVLTCHGQYFVNLASLEKEKIEASMKRMLDAARRVHECGGWSVTWHTAFFQGREKEAVYEIVRKNFSKVVKILRDEGINDVWLRPETTGKETQWGDLNETIKLSQEIEGVLPCVDFAHLHARYNGINNTIPEFRKIMEAIEKGLGKEGLNNMHIQICGINYGPKGEKNHINLNESDFNWKELLKVWKEFKIKGVVIDESPNVEGDALLLKKTYSEI